MKRIGLFLIGTIIFQTLFCQNVGIGMGQALAKLHVFGNVKSNEAICNGLDIFQNASPNRYLISNANGTGNWEIPLSPDVGSVGHGTWLSKNLTEYQPIGDDEGNLQDFFGCSVALNGNYAIVGSLNDKIDNIEGRGSATIYKLVDNVWVKEIKLIDTVGATHDNLGNAVAISFPWAFVASWSDDFDGFTDVGSVKIFMHDGNSWTFVQTVSDLFPQSFEYVGNTLFVMDDFLFIGAYKDQFDGHFNRGTVLVYKYNGNFWQYKQRLTDPTGAENDFFGTSISGNGTLLAIGSPKDDIGPNLNQGSVTIFDKDVNDNWNFQQEIIDNESSSHDEFGHALYMNGIDLIIGSPQDDVIDSMNQGSISTYVQSGNSFTKTGKIEGDIGMDFNFGSTISIGDELAIIGSPNQSHVQTSQGMAHVYRKINNVWTEISQIEDPFPGTFDRLSYSIGYNADQQVFIIGVPGFISNSGKVISGKISY